MNKEQKKQFRKISKGTKINPVMVVMTWEIWHLLSKKVQTSQTRNIIILSDKADWNEDVYSVKTVHGVFTSPLGVDYSRLVIIGDSDHIQTIIKDQNFKKIEIQTSIIDTSMDGVFDII